MHPYGGQYKGGDTKASDVMWTLSGGMKYYFLFHNKTIAEVTDSFYWFYTVALNPKLK